MVNDRTLARLESRIKERVAYCLEFELNDPRSAFLTVTKVELARDIGSVKVYYSVLGNEADRSKSEHMLASARGFVQKQMGRVLRTRRIPRITWVYDDSIEKLDHMERAIRQAMESDRAINPAAHTEVRPSAAPSPDEDGDEDRGEDEVADREVGDFLADDEREE